MLAIPYPRGSGGTPQKGTLNPGLTNQIAGKSKVANPNDPTKLLALNGGNYNGITTFTTNASLAEMGVVTDTVSYYVPATAKTQKAISDKDLSERPQNFLLKKVEGGSGNLYAVVGGGGMNEEGPK